MLSSNLQILHFESHVQFFDPGSDTRKTSPVSGTVTDMSVKKGHSHPRQMATGFGLRLAGMAKLVMGGGTRFVYEKSTLRKSVLDLHMRS